MGSKKADSLPSKNLFQLSRVYSYLQTPKQPDLHICGLQKPRKFSIPGFILWFPSRKRVITILVYTYCSRML